MNIIITEHYTSDGPITWICDVSKATPALQHAVNIALADKYKTMEGVTNGIGWQDPNNNTTARVLPPCQVDDAVDLYFD